MNDGAAPKLTVYGTPGCAMVAPVRELLKRAKVDYVYVDIRSDVEGRQQVRAINDGYESVPTLRFDDGETLTEPSMRRLRQALADRGYHVPPATAFGQVQLWLQHPGVRFGALLLGLVAANDRDGMLFVMALALFLTSVIVSTLD